MPESIVILESRLRVAPWPTGTETDCCPSQCNYFVNALRSFRYVDARTDFWLCPLFRFQGALREQHAPITDGGASRWPEVSQRTGAFRQTRTGKPFRAGSHPSDFPGGVKLRSDQPGCASANPSSSPRSEETRYHTPHQCPISSAQVPPAPRPPPAPRGLAISHRHRG